MKLYLIYYTPYFGKAVLPRLVHIAKSKRMAKRFIKYTYCPDRWYIDEHTTLDRTHISQIKDHYVKRNA